MPKCKKDLSFILVRTQFASNLGTSVRAMKNMGFDNLVLIEPECEVGVEARARSMKGAEILDRARYFPSLEEAQREIGVLVGTTGRFREGSSRLSNCRQFAEGILPRLAEVALGIVFGPEGNGLSRAELRLCQFLVSIPGGSEYPVMNLSQSVAVAAYELHLAFSKMDPLPPGIDQASAGQVQALLQQLEEMLGRRQLPPHLSRRRLMHRLRSLAARTPLQSEDLNMLRQLLRLACSEDSTQKRREAEAQRGKNQS